MSKNAVCIIIIVILTIMIVIMSGLLYSCKADTTYICCVPKGEVLWVRDVPDKNGNKVTSVRYGYEMKVSRCHVTDGTPYAHVTLQDGSDGWVNMAYIEMPIKEEIWVIDCDGPVNKRETPDGRYLTKIKSGSRVSVLGWRYSSSGELWAKTYHGGYVKAQYLKKASE